MLARRARRQRFGQGPNIATAGVTPGHRTGVTGVVGINGAGKSTLLSVLAGALKPTSGAVRLDGDEVFGSGRKAALRRVALMPQQLRVPMNVRARDVVEYIAWLRGLNGSDAKRAAADAVEAVGLSHVASKRVSSLSGGMQRRLALAQALATDPDVLLLDEPTTGLDPQQRVVLRTLLKNLPQDRITLLSSHVMEDLQSLCENVIVLHAGRTLFHGAFADFVSNHGGADASPEHAFLSLLTARNHV